MGEGINLDEYCADPENKAQVISDLATIAMESFCRPAYYPCDIIDWVGEKILGGSLQGLGLILTQIIKVTLIKIL